VLPRPGRPDDAPGVAAQIEDDEIDADVDEEAGATIDLE
jgi:hypothetical protein